MKTRSGQTIWPCIGEDESDSDIQAASDPVFQPKPSLHVADDVGMALNQARPQGIVPTLLMAAAAYAEASTSEKLHQQVLIL